MTDADVQAALDAPGDLTLSRFVEVLHRRGGKSAGAIRVSLGVISNFADVYRFVAFVRGLRDQTRLTIGEVHFDVASCRVVRDGS